MKSAFNSLLILTSFLTLLLTLQARHLRQEEAAHKVRRGGGSRPSGGGGSKPGGGGSKKPGKFPGSKPRPPVSSSGGNDNDDDIDEGECFPATATTTLQSGVLKPMSELLVGDSLRMADGSTSKVFAFSHRSKYITSTFLKFTATHGNLTVTPGHYIYASREKDGAATLRIAKDVGRGHYLEAMGGASRVLDVRTVQEKGLYNPHTMSEELVVDGFRVSTFTRAIEPRMATSALAPLRALFKVCGRDVISNLLVHGCPNHLKNGLHFVQRISN